MTQTSGARALATLLAYRDSFARWGVLGALAVGLVVLVIPRKWTSEARFVLQDQSAASGLLALAAQYGLGASSEASGQSAAFFADFVTSHDVLSALLDSTFLDASTGERRTLLEVLDVPGSTASRQRAVALRKLRERISGRASARTGVVTISATFTSPRLAADVVALLMAQVQEYSEVTRQSQAAAQRDFTSARLAELEQELRTAEDELATFVSRNRGYDSDPELRLQWQRLSRQVDAKAQLVTAMSQAREQARIDAVRDTPTITVVTKPVVPGLPDRRGLITKTFLALVLFGFAGAGWHAMREPLPGERADLELEIARLVGDLRNPINWIRRLLLRSQDVS